MSLLQKQGVAVIGEIKQEWYQAVGPTAALPQCI